MKTAALLLAPIALALAGCGGEAEDSSTTRSESAGVAQTSSPKYIPPSQSGAEPTPSSSGSTTFLVTGEADANSETTGTPVMIGHDGPDFDACGGLGKVVGLNELGDNFLAVRASPTASAEMLDKLDPEQAVWMCDANDTNSWTGVVYDKSGTLNCGVSSPVSSIRPYTGACKSGWVYGRFIQLIAG